MLTDIFTMSGFKPVVRLNVGDQLRAIGFPKREAMSGLVRVKATTVGKGKGEEYTGYVTVEGNQNSVYVESVDHLVFPENVWFDNPKKKYPRYDVYPRYDDVFTPEVRILQCVFQTTSKYILLVWIWLLYNIHSSIPMGKSMVQHTL